MGRASQAAARSTSRSPTDGPLPERQSFRDSSASRDQTGRLSDSGTAGAMSAEITRTGPSAVRKVAKSPPAPRWFCRRKKARFREGNGPRGMEAAGIE